VFYSSISNGHVKDLKKLNSKKYRDLSGLFLVDGEHMVIEAFNSGYLDELILLEGSSFSLDVRTSYVTLEVMKYISCLDSPSGVIGVCRKKDSVLSGNRIVILDDVQDPGNLGTIIRSSVAFNVDTLVMSHGCVDLYNPKVIRASQGMLFKLNIVITDIYDLIVDLKKNNYTVYSTSVIGGNSLKSIEKSSRFAIIMGNEGNGVSDSINSLCDKFIYIDMNPLCESLNVGVATSIILYELDK